MDMCMLDVTGIEGVAEGDEVVIIGSQGESWITAGNLADICGTISYEILCGIAERVPRVYCRNGEVVKVETLTSPLVQQASVGAG